MRPAGIHAVAFPLCGRLWDSVSFQPPLPKENTSMDKPRHHIAELESRIQQLSQDMMQSRKSREGRNRLETELRIAQ